jgi:hypothetical protein
MYSYNQLNQYIKDKIVNKFDMLGFVIVNSNDKKISYLAVGRVKDMGADQDIGMTVALRDVVVHDAKKNITETIDCILLNERTNNILPPLSGDWEVTHNAEEFKSEIVKREFMSVDFVSKVLDNGKEWKWDGKCFNCKTKVQPIWEICPYCRAKM